MVRVTDGAMHRNGWPTRWSSRSRADPLDWDRLVDITLARGIALPVGYSLRYLADEFAVEVPSDVGRRLDVATPPRARRMFARSGRGHDATRAERRLLGTGAGTYRFWVTESAPYDRRLAASVFPGWLADHWSVRRASQLPAAALQRVVRRVGTGISTRDSYGD
jgi:hypothetical protein